MKTIQQFRSDLTAVALGIAGWIGAWPVAIQAAPYGGFSYEVSDTAITICKCSSLTHVAGSRARTDVRDLPKCLPLD